MNNDTLVTVKAEVPAWIARAMAAFIEHVQAIMQKPNRDGCIFVFVATDSTMATAPMACSVPSGKVSPGELTEADLAMLAGAVIGEGQWQYHNTLERIKRHPECTPEHLERFVGLATQAAQHVSKSQGQLGHLPPLGGE